jgi:hypothetical protein
MDSDAGNGPGVTGFGGGRFGLRDAGSESPVGSANRKMSSRQIAAMEMNDKNLANHLAISEASNATSRANNQDSVGASIRNNDSTNQVSLRGQDITARGQDVTARTAWAKAQQDQNNWQAGHNLAVATHGEAVKKNDYERKETGIKSIHTQIENILPQVDGKPDKDGAARYTTALTAKLGEMQAKLQARAQAGDAQAAAQLKALGPDPINSLDEKDKARFIMGMKAKDDAAKYATGSHVPWGGTDVSTPKPIGALAKTSNGFMGFGGEYESELGHKIPARVIEGDGSFFGGTRNKAYEDMIITPEQLAALRAAKKKQQ